MLWYIYTDDWKFLILDVGKNDGQLKALFKFEQ